MQPESGEVESDHYTASWILWANSSEHTMPLPRSIDQVLSDYIFYHEADWGKFCYRPPDNLPLLGAWRDQDGSVFAFLLDYSSRETAVDGKCVLLHVSGMRDAVEQIGTRIAALKSNLMKLERKEIQVRDADHRIEQEKKSPAITSLLRLIGFFTVAVNAFSLYLRKLPTPDLPSPLIQDAYQLLVTIVHFSALFLFLIIIVIGIGYALRYGILILRRF